jgi:nucleotide-binding universal stress UspA family protein
MRILIALDSSPASQSVLGEATARPWPEGTTFSVLHVVELQRFARFPVLIDDAKREGDRIVKTAKENLAASGYKALSEVIMGFPRRSISEYAKEWSADLILAGSHGHSAVGRFLLGSVAQGILRTAPCSVEIVRRKTGVQVCASPMKILLATDGSDCSVAAAHSVADRPWPDRTVIKILSVEELIILDSQVAGYPLSSVYPQSLLEELTTQARDRVRSAIKAAREILQHSKIKVLDDEAAEIGEPRAVILETAKNWGADLIVLGSHGRNGMDRFLMGSVSEAVAIHAECSVEVVRG